MSWSVLSEYGHGSVDPSDVILAVSIGTGVDWRAVADEQLLWRWLLSPAFRDVVTIVRVLPFHSFALGDIRSDLHLSRLSPPPRSWVAHCVHHLPNRFDHESWLFEMDEMPAPLGDLQPGIRYQRRQILLQRWPERFELLARQV